MSIAPTAPPPAIVAADLTKTYGTTTVLDGVSVAVTPGSVYALLGPNGAGKTTLVRILTTLLRPDSGAARIADIDVVRRPQDARSAIGLVGQHAAVDEILTGRQNLELFGRLFHLGAKASRLRAQQLLAQFELVDAADRAVSTYSGGMRRRLDLAAGLILRPGILFLDEPTTGLDPRSRAEVWTAVRALVAQGTTVFLTTQYLEEADQLADTVGVIDRGRLIAQGTPAELKRGLGADRIEVVVSDANMLPVVERLVLEALGSVRMPDGGARVGLGPAVGAAPVTLDPTAGAASSEATTDPDRRALSVPVGHGLTALSAVVACLSAHADLGIEDVALKRPTLDDVFLSLTEVPASDLNVASTTAPAQEA